ncbi:MAG: ABC transporter permease [Chitinispirillaceae bacterium]
MSVFMVLAWRNLWRNRHRTLITMGSVFFAVILVLFVRSMQLGTYEHMITNTLKIYTGFIQVQGEEFWETRSLENSMDFEPQRREMISRIPGVVSVVPRLESFALASSGEKTRGAMVTGIAPEVENRMNDLAERVVKGEYLQSGSEGALIARGLAEYLDAGIGDTLILLSQGYYGASAAGAFAISGIVDLPLPDLNNSAVYLTLDQAQFFFSMPERGTSLAIMIEDPDMLGRVTERLQEIYENGYDVLTWREMLPELVQSIEFDNAGGLIMLGILYLVIAFGIFGTVMMMTAERKREFAMMISIGMKPRKLSLTVLFETITIGLLGTIAGVVVSIPILLYMRANPIILTGEAAEAIRTYGFDPLIPFLVEPSLFINQGLVVFLVSVLVCIYPLWSITRLKVSNELRA